MEPILATPKRIYDTVIRDFPEATAEVILRADSCVEMNIAFNRLELPILSLKSAVDRRSFERMITTLAQRTIIPPSLDSPLPSASLAVDSRNFSTDLALSDWQGFRRAMYESRGRKCAEVLSGYLQNLSGGDLVILSGLGLAPDQLTKPCAADLHYFRGICTPTTSKVLLKNLKERYPVVARELMQEEAQVHTERYAGRNIGEEIRSALAAAVLGQKMAISEVSGVLALQQRSKSGHTVFLFVGPSGVGKTELANTIANVKGTEIVTLNMEKYIEEHSYTQLFGAPTGYLGSDDLPHLAKKLAHLSPILEKDTPTAKTYRIDGGVILFDEFEKAHPKIKTSLLGFMDTGSIALNYTSGSRTSQGSNIECTYRLQASIIVCTSNLYKDTILKYFQDGRDISRIKEDFIKLSIKDPQGFPSEVLGRMTVIPFGPVPRGVPYQAAISKFITIYFSELVNQKLCKEIIAEDKQAIIRIIEEKLYGDGTDLRRIKRAFEKLKQLIVNNSHKWGDPLKTKVILFSDSALQTLHIKAETFLDGWDAYVPLGHIERFEPGV